MKNNEWYAKSKPCDIKALVDSHIQDLRQFMDELLNLLKPFTNSLLTSSLYGNVSQAKSSKLQVPLS